MIAFAGSIWILYCRKRRKHAICAWPSGAHKCYVRIWNIKLKCFGLRSSGRSALGVDERERATEMREIREKYT